MPTLCAARTFAAVSTFAAILAIAGGVAPRSTDPAAAASFRAGNRSPWQAVVTFDFRDEPLHKVLDYVAGMAGAKVDVLWKSDKLDGWDRDHPITLSLEGVSAMAAIERIVRTMNAEVAESSWQFTPGGELQIGTKDRLDKFKRLEVYDVNDLLFAMPIYNQAPEIDLQQVLQGSGRGGGGQPFTFGRRGGPNTPGDEQKSKEKRGEELISLITSVVEIDRWEIGGGSSATIRYHQGSLIVNGPDYMHRALAGFPGWPAPRSKSSSAKP